MRSGLGFLLETWRARERVRRWMRWERNMLVRVADVVVDRNIYQWGLVPQWTTLKTMTDRTCTEYTVWTVYRNRRDWKGWTRIETLVVSGFANTVVSVYNWNQRSAKGSCIHQIFWNSGLELFLNPDTTLISIRVQPFQSCGVCSRIHDTASIFAFNTWIWGNLACRLWGNCSPDNWSEGSIRANICLPLGSNYLGSASQGNSAGGVMTCVNLVMW